MARVYIQNLSMGVPEVFSFTWEQEVAQNMTLTPWWELTPGNMVSDLYQAYQQGVKTGKISVWNPAAPDDYVIGYVADTTQWTANLVRDFFDALVMTIAAGKAPQDALLAKADSGILNEAGDTISSAAQSVTDAAGSVAQKAALPITGIAIAAAGGLALYLMAIGIIPKPKFSK